MLCYAVLYCKLTSYSLDLPFQFPQEAFYLYDAVFAYSLALKRAFDKNYLDHVTTYMFENITKTPGLLSSLNITNFTMSDVIRGIWPGNDSDFDQLRNLTTGYFNFTSINKTHHSTHVVKDGRYVADQLFSVDFEGVVSEFLSVF